jgi:hypothetical protein
LRAAGLVLLGFIVSLALLNIEVFLSNFWHVLQGSICFSFSTQLACYVPVIPDNDAAFPRSVMWQNASLIDTRSLDERRAFFVLLYCCARPENIAQVPWPPSVDDPHFHSVVCHVHWLSSFFHTLSVKAEHLFQVDQPSCS